MNGLLEDQGFWNMFSIKNESMRILIHFLFVLGSIFLQIHKRIILIQVKDISND